MHEPEKEYFVNGMKISIRNMEETFDLVRGWLNEKNSHKSHLIITLNAVMWQKSCENSELHKIIANAELVTIDGFGIEILLRQYGAIIPERITGIDLLERLLQCCALEGHKVFLWGGHPKAVKKLKNVLSRKFSKLQVCYLPGYGAVSEAIKIITATAPRLVVAGLGCPKQEKALSELLPLLPGAVGIGVGGAFDVLNGSKRRAPRIFSVLGCEWFFRWIQSPRKIREAGLLLKFCRFLLWNVQSLKKTMLDYMIIFVGAAIVALGLSWILVPNRIASGGISGLAVIIYYLCSWPIAQTIFVLNLPLFFWSIRFFGLKYGLKTVWGTSMVSVMTLFWTELLNISPLTHEPLLASLYGGICSGLGMGLVFRRQGTTGGTDLAARLLNRSTGLSIGTSLLIFDGLVVIAAGLAFSSPELSLYALIAIAVSSKILDWVVNGPNYAKAALIISNKDELVGKKILERMNRGVTVWQGSGLYSGKERKLLLCVVGRSEIMLLKEIVEYCDAQAFVIIADAHEVLGRGFAEYSKK